MFESGEWHLMFNLETSSLFLGRERTMRRKEGERPFWLFDPKRLVIYLFICCTKIQWTPPACWDTVVCPGDPGVIEGSKDSTTTRLCLLGEMQGVLSPMKTMRQGNAVEEVCLLAMLDPECREGARHERVLRKNLQLWDRASAKSLRGNRFAIKRAPCWLEGPSEGQPQPWGSQLGPHHVE